MTNTSPTRGGQSEDSGEGETVTDKSQKDATGMTGSAAGTNLRYSPVL